MTPNSLALTKTPHIFTPRALAKCAKIIGFLSSLLTDTHPMMLAKNDLPHILKYLAALANLPEPSALKRLIDALRIKGDDKAAINNKVQELIDLLHDNPDDARGLSIFLLNLISQYHQITLYTDTGIASDHTFLGSMSKLVGHRFLPLLPEEDSVVELAAFLFDDKDDGAWIEHVEFERLVKLMAVISSNAPHIDRDQLVQNNQDNEQNIDGSAELNRTNDGNPNLPATNKLTETDEPIQPVQNTPVPDIPRQDQTHLQLAAAAKNSLLNAIVFLSYRIAGIGLHPDLMHVYPQILNYSAAFVAQNQEAVLFVNEYRRIYELDTLTDVVPNCQMDAAPLLVMLDQCQDIVNNIRKQIYKTGISIRMTNMLVRLEQSLCRMHTLIDILGHDRDKSHAAMARLAITVIHTAKNRYSFGYLVESNTNLLSKKVTENAGRVGEHYISIDKTGYYKMFKKAAIGGFFIGFMASMKTLSYHLALAPFARAFINSMIYGLGFVTIHVVHGTVATKQPAMTAAAIASTLSDGSGGKRTQQLTKLSELIVDILRTQFIAIMGNIAIAMPVALLIAVGWNYYYNIPMIDTAFAGHLLHDLDPIRSLALPHAAIAGVFLFLSGLISGYYDNLAAYNKIGERLKRHHLLEKLLPQKWLYKAADFTQNNLGAIMGNFIFGCFLGSTSTIGYMLGLPLDICHIAFSSANFVQGLFYLAPADLTFTLALTSFIGVLLIGFVNLMVSFALALFVALRSKDVTGFGGKKVAELVFWHFKTRPLDFIYPPRQSAQYALLSADGQIIHEESNAKERYLSDRYVVRRLATKKKKSDGKPKKGAPAEPSDTRAAVADHQIQNPDATDTRGTNNTDTAPDGKEGNNQSLTPLPKPEKPPKLPH